LFCRAISDPMMYYNRLNDERSALSRSTIFSAAKPALRSPHMIGRNHSRNKGRKPVRDEELEKTGTVLPTTIPDIEYGRGEIEKQITERTRQKIADFGSNCSNERFKRSKYNRRCGEDYRAHVQRATPNRRAIPFRGTRRSGEH